VKKMIAIINYEALKTAAEQLGVHNLPEAVTAEDLEDPDMIQKLHHAMMEIHLEEGALICPVTKRRFPVSKGIANMLLNADEV
jgi:multifunctional methyltransferase subunit TRM112